MGLGYFISAAPQLRLIESIICRHHYKLRSPGLTDGSEEVPEKLCKINAIQEAVAEVLGWQAFFDGIPGLLLTMFYGSLADRHGRRPVLVLSFLGQFLAALWIFFVCKYAESIDGSLLIWLC